MPVEERDLYAATTPSMANDWPRRTSALE